LASQWPIPPEHFFDYELYPMEGTAGSYFYHSHVDFQTVTASGPLIVEEAFPPPYEVDDERIVFLSELWNKTDATIVAGLQNETFTWSGETNGFLVNGKTISNDGATDASSTLLEVISVVPGKRYRFRFIAATSLSLVIIGIEDHPGFNIIEADGSYTKEQHTDYLQMGSGQRYSSLFVAKSCDELDGQLDFYIQIESRGRPTIVTNWAILRYENTCEFEDSVTFADDSYPSSAPITLPPVINGFLDYVLEPLRPNGFPPTSAVSRTVVINVQQYFNHFSVWQDNRVSWVEDSDNDLPNTTPDKPYLVSLYENETQYLPSYSAAIANGGLDPTTMTWPGKIGEVIDIIFQNTGSHSDDPNTTGGGLDDHPWHAHGRHYYDLGGGDGVYDPEIMEQNLKGTHPVLRDTTVLYRYNRTTQPDQKRGWRAWRLRVEQPGVWMIHCHTLQHMIMGMSTIWVFGDSADLMRLPALDVQGYLTYGGDVYGNSTWEPEVVHFSEELDGMGKDLGGKPSSWRPWGWP
jgi:L-ascorbate oxidase